MPDNEKSQQGQANSSTKSSMTTVYLLTTVPFIMVLGNSMLIPVLPAIQKAIHINLFQAGLLITFFSIPAGIIIPFAGLLSDHIGRKKVMAPALIIYGVGGILAGLASVMFKNSFPYILGARIIQGIGAGGTYQLAMALIGDLIQGKQRAQALGILEASNGLGKVVSPLAGAVIALITWYMPFFVYGVLALPIAAIVYFLAKEPQNKQKAQSTKEYLQGLKKIWSKKGPSLLSAFLAGTLVLFALFGLLSYLSDKLEAAKLGTFSRGLVIAIPVLFMAITSYILGTVLKSSLAKILKITTIVGLVFVSGGLVGFMLFSSNFLRVSAASLLGVGTGLVLPSLNTLITSAASASERGLVTCLYGTVRFFGVAIGPPVFGLADKLSRPAVFLGSAGLAAIAAIIVGFVINVKKVLPPEMLKGGGKQIEKNAQSTPLGGKIKLK
ncbi:MAG TPA: MFS transporter [Bacillota bacterium]|nr:MFS transporter [Bacillota bacterium]